ncbi:MAG: NAD(P)-dependent oxidoreductase [Candidatus Latescibacterota bacterium]|nr:NAD(P)-dependent oxidoreductase [Candidatus Latescibacterota bacterium]
MVKVVVFGAAGWLGRAILANLRGKHEVRAFDCGPEVWRQGSVSKYEGEIVHGEIADYTDVENAIQGMDAVVHTAVYSPTRKGSEADTDRAFLVNLKGLWNVLEAARLQQVRRVIHIGSCQTVHPEGTFFSAEVRRPDASLYAVNKRLQEEMCRQFWDGHRLATIVLRPDYIVDARLGIDKYGAELANARNGWVCRHDLAEACRLAVENEQIGFDIFHIVGTPEARDSCNVERSREVLGLCYRGAIECYR